MTRTILYIPLLVFTSLCQITLLAQSKPLRVGVAGLTHGHVHWVFQSEKRGDIEIVGIAEPNAKVVEKYRRQYGFPKELVESSLSQVLSRGNIEAVVAFGSIHDHLEVVRASAPLGIHVMVEKPLAVSLAHAREIRDLAHKHGVKVITNYETTWYPTNHKIFEMTRSDTLVGDIRKIIVRDGHRGPKKIGVSSEFFSWLTDPVLNGGGAVIDFGCYGANLVTWLMGGVRPKSVTAVTQQLQKQNNPSVDDESTIILTYDDATAIIQASWNWPIGRKDMEVHGLTGTLFADNRSTMRVRLAEGYDGYEEKVLNLQEREDPFGDPFRYLAAVVRGDLEVKPDDLSSLENNMIVMEILDAAVRSGKEGKTIKFD